jgi:hypothetical protein
MKKTFAQRAKAIKAKYKRADWDEIERKELYKEMQALKDEQEGVREAMGMGNEKQGEQTTDNEMMEQAYGGMHYKDGFDASQFLMPKINQNVKDIASNPVMPKEGNFLPMKSSFLPFGVSAGMSILGDVAGMISNRNNKLLDYKAPTLMAPQVNYEPQRQSIKRNFDTARNIALRNSRDMSSPSNAYANQVAGLSSLTNSLGDQLTSSYMNQENANVQSRYNTQLQNTQMQMQAQQMNNQQNDVYNQRQQGRMDSMFNTIPSAIRDYRQQVNEDNMLNSLGKDYGLYEYRNNNESSLDKFRRMMFGPQYQVRNKMAV